MMAIGNKPIPKGKKHCNKGMGKERAGVAVASWGWTSSLICL